MGEVYQLSERFWDKKVMVSYALSILVFWQHCSSFKNYPSNTVITTISQVLQKIITPAAVPLFLIISGVLFYRDYTNKKYIVKIKKRLYGLVIPYIAWNILGMLFEMFASRFFSSYFIGRQMFEFSLSNVFLGVLHYRYNGVFWFVFALIMFSIAAPIIDFLLSNKYVGGGVIILIAIGANLGIGLPVPFFFDQTCVVYYLVGAWIGKYAINSFAEECQSSWAKWISLLIFIGSCFYYVLIQNTVIENQPFFEVIVLTLTALSLWNLFDMVVDHIKVKQFMHHSFFVFAMHVNAGAVVAKLLALILPRTSYWALINFALTTIITLILIECFAVAIKRVSAPIYSVLSGNR